MVFKVTSPKFEQEFERWTDALEQAKELVPDCKGIFQEVRILEDGELVWVKDRFHRYPQFMGPGTYNRLARLFLQEDMEAEQVKQDDAS
ncbi:hypothetical protein C1752_01233 [Acaryochloris thomasi RCC1774]|uniref:PH domain-containing protein n=1 Tax=Acaryochloris thomasi RCC1774 TaxID=1764569 RepID=A0A2W1JMI2_9CYAN|nr:hypothetical protein [Acaryochloris thomasi]PZD74416.1 hypothetical protein C1752_01233 [Acaryochloris thomasi RCC1774]